MSKESANQTWRNPPPGTAIVKEGLVKQGDWFYIAELGAWGLVPKIGFGEPVGTRLIARGEVKWTDVDLSRMEN